MYPFRLMLLFFSALIASTTSHALVIDSSQALNFHAGKQSLWGPGGTAASFSASGSTGSSTLGFNYSAKASSGTVEQANFAGSLNYHYNDSIILGDADTVLFSFNGASNGGLIDTLFGLSVETNYQILGLSGCIYCKGVSLDINHKFTPKLDKRFTGSATATPATAAVGPDVGVGGASAGVDINVKQDSSLTATGISGTLLATHGSSASKQLTFDILDNGTFAVDLDLNLLGDWEISLLDISLKNEFFSNFEMSLSPFAKYYLGFNCGDEGTDDDNGFGCARDDKASWDLPGIKLGSTNPFQLAFNQIDLQPFTINVKGNTPVGVPEPGSWMLLSVGIFGLSVRRRLAARD